MHENIRNLHHLYHPHILNKQRIKLLLDFTNVFPLSNIWQDGFWPYVYPCIPSAWFTINLSLASQDKHFNNAVTGMFAI